MQPRALHLLFITMLTWALLPACKEDEAPDDSDDPSIVLYEFNRSVTASGTTIGVGRELEVDLDRDGTNDIVMTAFYSYFPGKSYMGINGTNLYVSSDTTVFFAPGSIISSASKPAIDNTVYSNADEAGFVGFSIEKSDGIHFGWFKAGGAYTLNPPLVSVTANIQGAAIKVPVNEGIQAGKY